MNGNTTGSLSFVLLEQQQHNNNAKSTIIDAEAVSKGGSEVGGGGDVAVGSQSHKLYFLLPAQRSLLLSGRAGEAERKRFETSHTLLSAAHATATHSPAPLPACLPLSHVSASLEWANVSCVLSTVSPALRERERDGERESKGRAECDAKRVLKFCLAALPTSLLLLSVVVFFCVIA